MSRLTIPPPRFLPPPSPPPSLAHSRCGRATEFINYNRNEKRRPPRDGDDRCSATGATNQIHGRSAASAELLSAAASIAIPDKEGKKRKKKKTKSAAANYFEPRVRGAPPFVRRSFGRRVDALLPTRSDPTELAPLGEYFIRDQERERKRERLAVGARARAFERQTAVPSSLRTDFVPSLLSTGEKCVKRIPERSSESPGRISLRERRNARRCDKPRVAVPPIVAPW